MKQAVSLIVAAFGFVAKLEHRKSKLGRGMK